MVPLRRLRCAGIVCRHCHRPYPAQQCSYLGIRRLGGQSVPLVRISFFALVANAFWSRCSANPQQCALISGKKQGMCTCQQRFEVWMQPIPSTVSSWVVRAPIRSSRNGRQVGSIAIKATTCISGQTKEDWILLLRRIGLKFGQNAPITSKIA